MPETSQREVYKSIVESINILEPVGQQCNASSTKCMIENRTVFWEAQKMISTVSRQLKAYSKYA